MFQYSPPDATCHLLGEASAGYFSGWRCSTLHKTGMNGTRATPGFRDLNPTHPLLVVTLVVHCIHIYINPWTWKNQTIERCYHIRTEAVEIPTTSGDAILGRARTLYCFYRHFCHFFALFKYSFILSSTSKFDPFSRKSWNNFPSEVGDKIHTLVIPFDAICMGHLFWDLKPASEKVNQRRRRLAFTCPYGYGSMGMPIAHYQHCGTDCMAKQSCFQPDVRTSR